MERNAPPQWAFLGSLIAYPTLHLASLPSKPSFCRIAQSREAISIFHVTLQTILSALCLRHYKHALEAPSEERRGTLANPMTLPIMRTRSTFAQCITALEAGYLLQDSVVLLQGYRNRNRNVANTPQIKGWNFLHLGLHHAGLGSLLLILQYYIAKQQEKGILVIIALHLMNASSIFGTLRWFLVNFRPRSHKAILLTTAMYLVAFAAFRVYLIVWIMRIYARQRGPSVWRAIQGLPSSCKIGTGTMLAVNTIWLMIGIRNLAVRIASRTKTD